MTNTIFVVIPVFLNNPLYSKISRVEVIPGVFFSKASQSFKQELEKYIKRNSIQPRSFVPTHLVIINKEKYKDYLLKDIYQNTQLTDKQKEAIENEYKNYLHLRAEDIAKQLLVSLTLIENFYFLMSGFYNCSGTTNTKGKLKLEINSSIFRETPHKPNWFMSRLENHRPVSGFSSSNWKTISAYLTQYYRPVLWKSDRLATALSCYWNALCTTYDDQIFLSLTTLLEALLSTGDEGITHQISERGAVLLGKNKGEKLKIYDDIRRIYNVRSKIIHGSSIAKENVLNENSLHIDTKYTVIPIDKLSTLFIIATNLLLKVLSSPDLVRIIQDDKKQEKINEALKSYFLELLLK